MVHPGWNLLYYVVFQHRGCFSTSYNFLSKLKSLIVKQFRWRPSIGTSGGNEEMSKTYIIIWKCFKPSTKKKIESCFSLITLVGCYFSIFVRITWNAIPRNHQLRHSENLQSLPMSHHFGYAKASAMLTRVEFFLTRSKWRKPLREVLTRPYASEGFAYTKRVMTRPLLKM